jgi:hypothetical protein
MACFLLVTILPLRPLFSFPCFIARISVSTFFPTDGEYFRVDFFVPVFFADFVVITSPCTVRWHIDFPQLSRHSARSRFPESLPGEIPSENREEETADSDRAKSEFHVARKRNGPTGVVYLNFIAKFTCFENPETIHQA